MGSRIIIIGIVRIRAGVVIMIWVMLMCRLLGMGIVLRLLEWGGGVGEEREERRLWEVYWTVVEMGDYDSALQSYLIIFESIVTIKVLIEFHWKKVIARTKNVFQNNEHMCILNGEKLQCEIPVRTWNYNGASENGLSTTDLTIIRSMATCRWFAYPVSQHRSSFTSGHHSAPDQTRSERQPVKKKDQ